MKVALVHDYLREFGGAERVLEALSELYPNAPIYTAFVNKKSEAYKRFKNRKIITSWAQYVPFFVTKLHSPLRFLAPLIWGSFNLSNYDVVVSSAGWYITKGFGIKNKPIEFCYCHTPPRWLYGYKTSVQFQKYWPVKVYANIVGKLMRKYDYDQAQKVDYFIANSNEVAGRIKKFYNRDATVIYPPVGLPNIQNTKYEIPNTKKSDYYFIVSRLVGAKGIELAIVASKELGFNLKIAGTTSGYGSEFFKEERDRLLDRRGNDSQVKFKESNIEFLGFVSDEELVRLYKNAKAFLALAQDEDFGITPVEAMQQGTPVIAYKGGGYQETVVDGKTGLFFDKQTVQSLSDAILRFEKMNFSPEDCRKQGERFSKERFKKEISQFIKKHTE